MLTLVPLTLFIKLLQNMLSTSLTGHNMVSRTSLNIGHKWAERPRRQTVSDIIFHFSYLLSSISTFATAVVTEISKCSNLTALSVGPTINTSGFLL